MPKSASDVLTRGDVIYVVTDGEHGAQLAQVPEAQAALVALDPHDGAVAALVGGFDYFANKYNRAVQAERQPGSGFKPFLYSAALDAGFTPASPSDCTSRSDSAVSSTGSQFTRRLPR